jgi:hypothetical protein
MSWEGCGRKRTWHNLRCYPDIRLDVLRTTTETSVTVVCFRVEIGTRHFPNASQALSLDERWRYRLWCLMKHDAMETYGRAVQFFTHLHAELKSQWPMTQPSRIQNNNNNSNETTTRVKRAQGQIKQGKVTESVVVLYASFYKYQFIICISSWRSNWM